MGSNLYEGVKKPTKLLLWGHWLSCCLLFLDIWDESDLNCSQTGPTATERDLFFDKSIPCWEVSTGTTSDRCFLLCVKMHQIAIAGKRLFDPFHIIDSSITTSAGFSVVFSLSWRQQFFDMSSCFFTLPGLSWQTKKPYIPCSTCEELSPSLCCVSAQCFSRAGKGRLGNYKAHQT